MLKPPLVTVIAGRLHVATYNREDDALVQQVPGRVRHAKNEWAFALTHESLDMLQAYLPAVEIGQDVRDAATQLALQGADVEVARTMPLPVPHGMPVKLAPYEHQQRAYHVGLALLRRKGVHAFALLHDVGLGKTLTTTAIIGKLYEGKLRRVLVVCPKSVIGVWEREVTQYADYPVRVAALTGTMPRKCAQVAALEIDPALLRVTFVVVNYESVWRPPMLKVLEQFNPQLVVCDEAHRLKNPSSKQAKALTKLAHRKGKIAATGTPIDRPQDWYGIYRFLDPTVFGTNSTVFRHRYFEMRPLASGISIIDKPKPHMQAELVAKAHTHAHACSKDDALDLPDQVDIEHYCQLEPEAAKMYKQLREECITFLESGEAVVASTALTKILRLAQITGGFTKSDDGKVAKVSKAKLDLFRKVLDDVLETERKIVVFAQRTAEIKALSDIARRVPKCSVGVIDGSVPAQERTRIVAAFQDEDEPRVLVIQTQAGGAGITLHASALTIYYSHPASSIDYEQSQGRIHRTGQTRTCRYLHLLAENTIDKKLLDALRSKQATAQSMIHNWKELLG